MNRDRALSVVIRIAPIGLVVLAGCSAAHPAANVSDLAVFTSLHLLAAEASSDAENANDPTALVENLGSGPFTAAHMHRYFESTTQAYKPERMDAMLDGQQHQSAFAQAVQRQAALGIAANLTPTATGTGVTAPTPPTTTQFVSEQIGALNALLAQQSANPLIDSPFDQLDRIADFYAAYVVKNLRVRGDSRVISPEELTELLITIAPAKDRMFFNHLLKENKCSEWANEPDPKNPADRLLLLVFQTHVDPGSCPDQMVGVRLHIDEQSQPIKIIRLHPTRTYDVDSGLFSQSEQSSLSMATNVGAKVAGKVDVQVDGTSSGSEQNLERQRYLSHISKVTSYSDAGLRTFGFNFYPSNVKITPLNPIASFFAGKKFQAHGYLEGGARDCAAIVVLPRKLSSFKCRVSYVSGPYDGEVKKYYLDKCGVVHDMTAALPPDDAEEINVPLPPWNPVELLAATVGAAPVRLQASAATMPSSQPVDYTETDDTTVTHLVSHSSAAVDPKNPDATQTKTSDRNVTIHHHRVAVTQPLPGEGGIEP